MRGAGIPDSVPLFLGEYNVDGGDYNDPNNGNMVGAVSAAATTYAMIHSNTNFTMGAVWDVQNDSSYSIFGSQGSYHANPVGVVLGNLTAYMPGTLVQTTMPNNTPGLVGYTTRFSGGFSTALINTNLSQGYTVDLSRSGLPTTGLYRVEVSNANPQGIKVALTDLAHVFVAAGSVVIVTNEASHAGVQFDGGSVAQVPVSPVVLVPVPTPATVGTGADTLVLNLSEGAYLGNAQFSVAVDGKQLGSAQAVSALHGQGQSEAFTFKGDFGPGNHSVGVSFLNDASGGTPATDRNLFIDGATFNGSAAGSPATLGINSTVSFPVTGSVAPPPAVQGTDTLTLKPSEDAWQRDAVAMGTIDGKTIGGPVTVSAAHNQGSTHTATLSDRWGAGSYDVGVQFLNDA
jgi:hypothetical protein